MKKEIFVDKKRISEANKLWFSFLSNIVHLALQYGESRSERFKLMLVSSILQEGYISKATKEIEFVNNIKPDDELGNFVMANVYRWSGKWKDSARVYLRVLRKNPNSKEAKDYLKELKQIYSPKIEDNLSYLSEPISQRIENKLYFLYPISNYFTGSIGTTFLSISDNTGSIYRNQDFYKASGSATAIGGFLGVSYLLAKMYTKLSFQIDLKKYKGKIDYEENTLEDADISYMSINYKLSVFLNRLCSLLLFCWNMELRI
jgi:tetratricopeptide (TPR) repeat protein